MARGDPLIALHHTHVDHVGEGAGCSHVQTEANTQKIVIALLQLLYGLYSDVDVVDDTGVVGVVDEAGEHEGRLHDENVTQH